MFDHLFTPAVFPGTEIKNDIISDAKVVRRNHEIENLPRTRRISRVGNRDIVRPPYGYGNEWGN